MEQSCDRQVIGRLLQGVTTFVVVFVTSKTEARMSHACYVP